MSMIPLNRYRDLVEASLNLFAQVTENNVEGFVAVAIDVIGDSFTKRINDDIDKLNNGAGFGEVFEDGCTNDVVAMASMFFLVHSSHFKHNDFTVDSRRKLFAIFLEAMFQDSLLEYDDFCTIAMPPIPAATIAH